MSVLKTLKRCDLFSSLAESDLKLVSRLFKEVEYRNNDTIFNEGDPSDRFYIVSRGSVKIIKHTVMGKDVIIEMMSPGDIFGGVAVLDRKPYPASAQAMENTSVIYIERNQLLNLMEEFPVLKLEVVKYFSTKLRDAHEMLKNIATERVERRIAGLLLKLSEKVGIDDGDYRRIDFPLTRQEIAEMVGTTVETCIRTISRFQKKGIVKSSDGRVSIKVDAIKKIVEE